MLENLLALIVASTLLVLLPGPNVALIVAGSVQHGRRFGLATVAGTTAGVAVQLVLVVAGFNALLGLLAGGLAVIKWVGVAVLLWFGLAGLLARTADAADCNARPAPSLRAAFFRGALLATVNPKTLLFNAAFLPQFVDSAAAASWQLPVLGAVYLLVIAAGDAGWAWCASAARRWLTRTAALRQRVGGACLLAAGSMLAIARVER